MNDQENPLPQEEADFQRKYQADSEEIRQFYEKTETAQEANGVKNPQYRMAPEYFQIYLENKPSKVATQALEKAFTMWENLEGVSDQIHEALTHIAYEEDVWDWVERPCHQGRAPVPTGQAVFPHPASP